MQAAQVKILKGIILILIVTVIILNIALYQSDSNTIKIGTKNLTEQRIIATVYKDIIEDNTDYNVQIVNGLDTTSFVHNALLDNDIDMYVEYSSTAYLEVFKHIYQKQSDEEIYQELIKDYEDVGLSLNSPLGFENSNAIICSSFCDDITSISDLDSQEFSFAAPAYFFERSDGYNLLAEAYDFSNVEIIKADPVVIYSGIKSGQIDVGLGFTTDAKLTQPDIKILEDTDHIFPTYDAILVSTGSFDKEYPEANRILLKLADKMTTEDIQALNNRVLNKQETIEDVARDYADYLEQEFLN